MTAEVRNAVLAFMAPPRGMTTREDITEHLRYSGGIQVDDRSMAKLLADLATDDQIRVDSFDNVGPEFVSLAT